MAPSLLTANWAWSWANWGKSHRGLAPFLDSCNSTSRWACHKTLPNVFNIERTLFRNCQSNARTLTGPPVSSMVLEESVSISKITSDSGEIIFSAFSPVMSENTLPREVTPIPGHFFNLSMIRLKSFWALYNSNILSMVRPCKPGFNSSIAASQSSVSGLMTLIRTLEYAGGPPLVNINRLIPFPYKIGGMPNATGQGKPCAVWELCNLNNRNTRNAP